MFSRGGTGLLTKTGRFGSEKAGSASGRGYADDVGCNVLGDGFLSDPPMSPNGRDDADNENGEGRPCAGGIGAEDCGAYDRGFAPEITSEMDGNDCRWEWADSDSSECRRSSTGEIMPGMLLVAGAE